MAFNHYLDEERDGWAADSNDWGKSSSNWEGLDDANAKAAKRMKAEELRKKLENLKAQRAEVVARRDAKIAERKALRDEDIVAMGKVKGISDSDLQQYINGRVTQRNADISNAQTAAQKGVESAVAEETKAKNKRENVNQIFDLEQKITENSVRLSSGNKKEKAAAMAVNRTLMNQYENALEDYKKLNDGKEWVSNIGEEEESNVPSDNGEESNVPSDNGEVEIPEGITLNETEQAEMDSYGADTDKKNALIAKKKMEARIEKENKVKRQKQLNGIKSDLEALGVTSAADISKKLYDKTLDNDQVLKPIKDRVLAFIRSDNEYNTIKNLEKLWGK